MAYPTGHAQIVCRHCGDQWWVPLYGGDTEPTKEDRKCQGCGRLGERVQYVPKP